MKFTKWWRHNGHDSISNHQPYDCLLNRLFRRRWKKTSKLCVTGLWTWEFTRDWWIPPQMASNAENVSIWWRHHADNHRPVSWVITGLGFSLLLVSCQVILFEVYQLTILITIKPLIFITHAPLFRGGENYVCESPKGDSCFVMYIHNPFMHCVTSQYVFKLRDVIMLMRAVTIVAA